MHLLLEERNLGSCLDGRERDATEQARLQAALQAELSQHRALEQRAEDAESALRQQRDTQPASAGAPAADGASDGCADGEARTLTLQRAAPGAESAPGGAPAKDDGHDHSAQLHAWLRDANLELADLRQKLADAEPHRVRRRSLCTHAPARCNVVVAAIRCRSSCSRTHHALSPSSQRQPGDCASQPARSGERSSKC